MLGCLLIAEDAEQQQCALVIQKGTEMRKGGIERVQRSCLVPAAIRLNNSWAAVPEGCCRLHNAPWAAQHVPQASVSGGSCRLRGMSQPR